MKCTGEVKFQLQTALNHAEAALSKGDAPTARLLLTGLEPRLLVAGLGASIPRFFRLGAECEHQSGNAGEAIRLLRKGLARFNAPDPEERRRFLLVARRIVAESGT